MRRLLLSLPVLAVVAALLAGGRGTGAPTAQAATAMPMRTATVTTTKNAKLGTILTDAKHRTLYLFEKDKNGKSSCSGACASLWPPLLTNGHAKATGAVKASHLATTTRSDGHKQVTYFNHPLYYYAPDHKAGDTTGQKLNQFGGLWFVVAPSGKAITK